MSVTLVFEYSIDIQYETVKNYNLKRTGDISQAVLNLLPEFHQVGPPRLTRLNLSLRVAFSAHD